jgi:hypothetical protein
MYVLFIFYSDYHLLEYSFPFSFSALLVSILGMYVLFIFYSDYHLLEYSFPFSFSALLVTMSHVTPPAAQQQFLT